jgi:hypothetical protein
MLLKNIVRQTILPSIFILASVIHAGCSSDSGVHYAEAAADSPQPAVTATPLPIPNPDQAAGLITRFYRDIDTNTKESVKDLFTIVTPDFVRNHHDDLIADYSFIRDPKVEVQSIHGRTVSYTLDYIYLAEAGRLYWERTGRWVFNHGAESGWVLDADTWDSVHLVGISPQDHADMVAVQDTVHRDGRHEFTFEGQRYSFLAKGDDWHITAVATPTPQPIFTTSPAAANDTSGDSSTTTDSAAPDSTVASSGQMHFDDPNAAQAKCPNDVVVWVNTRSGVYHMPDTRWYGMTEYGVYECETDAISEGDRQSRNGQ